MRTIAARWSQPCKACGESIAQNAEARYDDATKRIYHPACEPVEASGVDPAALGFLLHDEAVQKDWTRTEE